MGQNERLRSISEHQRLLLNSSTIVSSSTTGTNNSGSEIQQHLQSMFCLLRPEETLKMVRRLYFFLYNKLNKKKTKTQLNRAQRLRFAF